MTTADRLANALGYAAFALLMTLGVGGTIIIVAMVFDPSADGERWDQMGMACGYLGAVAFLVGLRLGWRRPVPPLLLHLSILVGGGFIAAWSLIGWVSFLGSTPHWRGKVVTAVIVAVTVALFLFASRKRREGGSASGSSGAKTR